MRLLIALAALACIAAGPTAFEDYTDRPHARVAASGGGGASGPELIWANNFDLDAGTDCTLEPGVPASGTPVLAGTGITCTGTDLVFPSTGTGATFPSAWSAQAGLYYRMRVTFDTLGSLNNNKFFNTDGIDKDNPQINFLNGVGPGRMRIFCGPTIGTLTVNLLTATEYELHFDGAVDADDTCTITVYRVSDGAQIDTLTTGAATSASTQNGLVLNETRSDSAYTVHSIEVAASAFPAP